MKRWDVTILVLVMAAVIVAAASPASGAIIVGNDEEINKQMEELRKADPEIVWIDEDASGQKKSVWFFSKEEINKQIEELRKADPKTAEVLEVLREEDPEKFKTELRKHMAEVGSKGQKGGGTPCGCRSLNFPKWLEQNYPEEGKELAELKEKDHQLYKKRYSSYSKKYRKIYEASKDNAELAEILKEDLELKEQRDELLEQVGKLKIVCDESSTDKTKAECEEKISLCREKMEEVLTKRFDLIVRRKEIEYEQLLDKLRRLQEQVEWRKSELENWRDPEFMRGNVKGRLAELLGERDRFRWD